MKKAYDGIRTPVILDKKSHTFVDVLFQLVRLEMNQLSVVSSDNICGSCFVYLF
jgi:hypothetical protein